LVKIAKDLFFKHEISEAGIRGIRLSAMPKRVLKNAEIEKVKISDLFHPTFFIFNTIFD